MVPNARISRQVRSFGADCGLVLSRSYAPKRCTTPVIRIIENMSDDKVTAWSELRLGASPASSTFWIAGMPCPMVISIAGESDT